MPSARQSSYLLYLSVTVCVLAPLHVLRIVAVSGLCGVIVKMYGALIVPESEPEHDQAHPLLHLEHLPPSACPAKA